MNRTDGPHTTRTTIIRHANNAGNVTVDATWWRRTPREYAHEEIVSIITLDTGTAHLQITLSPSEARDLAANLKLHADEVEAARRELQETVAA